MRLFAAIIALAVTLGVSAADKIKVACVGNSITYGFGIDDREHDSYPAQLQRMLGDGYEVGNFGKSGATLLRHGHRPYFEQAEYKAAVAFGADIAVIHLGINDTDPRDWPNHRDEFVGDYLALIDSLRSSNPDMRFIIARLTPIADRHPRFISGTKLWHDEIQTAIETVARVSGVELIDFHEPLYAFPFLLPDAIHPNVEGAKLLAQTVYAGITGDYGGLSMSAMYTDNMVLQRDAELRLSGVANAGDKVTVAIGKQEVTTVADNRGRWGVTLQPLTAGTGYTLTVSTPETKLQYSNVAVGEVWLCSGQSNMQFMLKQAVTAKDDIAHADDSGLRLYDMKTRWDTSDINWPASACDSVNHLKYYRPASWQPATSESAANFSAVAYHFGRVLRDSLQVPVGLICNAVGGSTTESWIDRGTLETQFPAILNDWMNNDFIQDWARGRAAVNIKLAQTKGSRHPYEPCYLYESGILPLGQYPIKGVIWYQGESNAHNFEAHETLFRLLVQSWRSNWDNPEMPFYFVQLSSLSRPSWPWFRDSQRRLMQQIAGTGMAVTIDRGDSLDVHPRFKREIGERLSRWALNKTYAKAVTPSGPLFRSAELQGDAVVVHFDYAEGLRPVSGAVITGFEIAETEGLFYPAVATVEGDALRLSSPSVKHPKLVRYAWQPFTRANLVNADGLPASTFRCEL